MLETLYINIVSFWYSLFKNLGVDEFLILKENGELNINNIEGIPYTYTTVCTIFDILVQVFSILTLFLIFYMLYKIIKLIICRISGC